METAPLQATTHHIRALTPSSNNIINHLDLATAVLDTIKAILLFQTINMAASLYQAVVTGDNLLHKASSVKSQALLPEKSTPNMPNGRNPLC